MSGSVRGYQVAQTATVKDPGNASRGEALKKVAFATEAWSEAQQIGSKVMAQGMRKISLGGESYKILDTRKKRKFVAKKAGVQDTDVQEQNYSRRAIFTSEYHAATQADIGDLIDSGRDIFADSRKELMNDEGRLIDTIALSALVCNHSSVTDAAKDATSLRLTADIGLASRRKLITFHTKKSSAVTFTPDNIEDLLYLFAVRDVESQLCATLTPNVKKILRKDSEFKNAENIYAPVKRSVDDSREGFRYKNVTWVSISESVLPLISTDNVGLKAPAAVTNARSAVTFISRDAGTADYTSGHDTAGTVDVSTVDKYAKALGDINGATGTDAAAKLVTAKAAADLQTVTTDSASMVYIWAKEALLFADRPQGMLTEDAILPYKSHARQQYVRVVFGSVLEDENFALVVPCKGTVA